METQTKASLCFFLTQTHTREHEWDCNSLSSDVSFKNTVYVSKSAEK